MIPARISKLSDICGSHCRVGEDSSLLVFDTSKQTGLKSHELIQCVHISKRPWADVHHNCVIQHSLRDGIRKEANQRLSDTPVKDCKDSPTKDCLMNANNSVIVGRKTNAIWREGA